MDAFIWDSTKLEFEAAKSCQLKISGNLFGHSVYGIGLTKGSPWTKHFSLGILSLIESDVARLIGKGVVCDGETNNVVLRADGTLENLESKWITSVRPLKCLHVGTAPARLSLTNMRGESAPHTTHPSLW